MFNKLYNIMIKTLKTKLMLLLGLMFVGGGSAWGETKTLTIGTNPTNSTATGYITAGTTFTIDGVNFAMNNYQKNGQLRGNQSSTSNNFYVYNTSAIPGTIKSVVINITSGASTFISTNVFLATATSQINSSPTSGNPTTSGSNPILATWSDLSGTFFRIAFAKGSTSGNCKMSGITITYEVEDASLADAEFSFGATTSFTVAPNEDFTAPTLTTATGYDGTVTYSSSNESIALVDESTGDVVIGNVEGTATITAKANATSNFKADEASYTITVIDNREVPTLSFSESEVRIALNATEYTLPTLNNPSSLTVSYSSSDDNVITEVDGEFIVATDAVGEATMTATFAGNTTYKPANAQFKVIVYDPNAKGTKQNPYSVHEVIAMNPTETGGTSVAGEAWVLGYIVGSYSNDGLTSEYVVSNLALADSYDETDSEYVIPVQLVNSTAPRTNFNPVDKPYNVNIAKVLVKADVFKYFGVPGLKNTTDIEKVAEQVSITSAGMATYYTDCALDFTEFSDMYAYTATVSDDAISFTRVMQVPAKTGVLLRNPAKAGASNVVPVATEEVAAVEGNAFVGTLENTTVEGDGKYILNNGSNGLGFYKVKADGGNDLAAHRAYLNAGSNTRSFIGFDNDETTGIATVGEGQQTVTFYNLQGVRVSQPTKGLYIVNGKKAIFK